MSCSPRSWFVQVTPCRQSQQRYETVVFTRCGLSSFVVSVCVCLHLWMRGNLKICVCVRVENRTLWWRVQIVGTNGCCSVATRNCFGGMLRGSRLPKKKCARDWVDLEYRRQCMLELRDPRDVARCVHAKRMSTTFAVKQFLPARLAFVDRGNLKGGCRRRHVM